MNKNKIFSKYNLASSLAFQYLNFTGFTTPIIWKFSEEIEQMKAKGSQYIHAVWHNQQAFLIYAYRFKKMCALVSLSKDGEYMAQLLSKFGIKSVRGSTSRGASQAVMKLINIAKEGYYPVLTPDGPRGPRNRVQPGALFLAQKTGLPIVPIACGLKRKVIFNSWDKFELPLPFGKAAVVYGRPITVSEKDDMKEKSLELQTELNRISNCADKLVS